MTYQVSIGDKLTTVVRDDLSLGQQLVQTAHAVADFAVEHKEAFVSWKHGSNYLCCLSSSLIDILTLKERLDQLGVHNTLFREPDIGNEVTAIAIEALPKTMHTKIFKHFKLAIPC